MKVPELNVNIDLVVDTGAGTYDLIYLGDPGTAAASVIGATVRTGAGHSAVVLATDPDDPATATIDFGSGGVGNTLDVFDGATTAYIAHTTGGTGTIDVDQVRVHSGNVVIQSPTNIDELSVNSDGFFTGVGTATIAAGSTISQAFVALNCTASVQAQSTIGPFEVDGTANFTAGSTVERFTGSSGTVNVYGGAVTVTNTSVMGGGSDLNVVGSASSVLFQATGSEVENLTVTDGGLFTLDARVGSYFRTRFVDVGPQTSPTGKLDLTDGGLIIDHFGTTPYNYVKAVTTTAYAGGAWTGNGIGSSTAANSAIGDGIGYAEATDIFTSFPATFLGNANVDNTSVLLRYTLYGDANVDGTVNLQDFNRLAANFGTGTRWDQGDSTYDGAVDLADFNRLAGNFGMSVDPGDGGGEGFGDGGDDYMYTYDELLEMLIELNPEDF